MNIEVDRELCELHAQCVYAAPAVFSIDDDDELVYDPAPGGEHLGAVHDAITACPVQAITLLGARQ